MDIDDADDLLMANALMSINNPHDIKLTALKTRYYETISNSNHPEKCIC